MVVHSCLQMVYRIEDCLVVKAMGRVQIVCTVADKLDWFVAQLIIQSTKRDN